MIDLIQRAPLLKDKMIKTHFFIFVMFIILSILIMFIIHTLHLLIILLFIVSNGFINLL